MRAQVLLGPPRSSLLLAIVLAATGVLAVSYERVVAQAGLGVQLDTPQEGEVVRGVVAIRGTAAGPNFASAELAFAYVPNPADAWFTIAELLEPVQGGELASWNTAEISDGAYTVRLRLRTDQGAVEDAAVQVQVRNYTTGRTEAPTITVTSPPVVQVSTPVIGLASATAARAMPWTPTALPVNAAALSSGTIIRSFLRGGLAVLALGLIVLGRLASRRS